MSEESAVRLARLIANRGVSSRREAEAMIEQGQVKVNGETVYHPGHPVDPEVDHIRIDGRALPSEPRRVYYLMYKPRGVITGRRDPDGRQGVHELLDGPGPRVEPVGRLDINTEGALLLTNDGELANKLTQPSSGIPKRYLVKVWKTPSPKTLARIERGKVYLEDGPNRPCKVRVMEGTDSGNAWVEITVTEGRNRLIRRLFAAVGHPVSKLRRESFATLSVRGMERGQVRPLTGEEVRRLKDIAAGKKPARAGKKKKAGFAKAKPKNKRNSRRGVDRKRRGVK
jgi:23S rRNA pseudouridine2605 synthase